VKRFWTSVEVGEEGGGWGVRLDGRPLKTPARATLAVPTQMLAEAVAGEWCDVDGEVEPRAMPLTGLSNAAIDRIAPARQDFAALTARYGEADLACYRTEWPPELAARQIERWDPLLVWARRRYDVDFSITSGLMHVPQPPATIERLAHEVAALDAFQLAGLSPLATVGGSLVAALAVFEKAVPADEAWQAVSIDERWQLEQWGADPQAEAALDLRRRDFLAGAAFLDLLEV
jgi:chaperone required for assembly of F1-ATPase